MKHNIVVRMGAPQWSAQVRHENKWLTFDFRKMTAKERGAFHRELLNAVRARRDAA